MKLSPIQIERIKAGVQALKYNPLKAVGQMRNEDGGRCCLCVLQDKAIELGFEGKTDGYFLPSEFLCEFYGFEPDDNKMPVVGGISMENWNDGQGEAHRQEKTHQEIAIMIEQEYLTGV